MSHFMDNFQKIKTWSWIIGLLFIGCSLTEDQPPLDNPYNPDDPNYIPPETYLLSGPTEGTVLDTHTVTFSWRGNEGVTEYSYQLNTTDWSDWSADTTVTFTYLDEGDYVFEVKGRYNVAAEDSTPEIRSFGIDDVHGPALMFGPRKVASGQGNNFVIELRAEEVTDLMAVYAEIQYDSTALLLNSYQILNAAGDFLRMNNGTVVDIVEVPQTGLLQVNLGVATGNPPGVEGSGALIRLNFTPLVAGVTNLVLTPASSMLDSNLGDIPITELVPGVVEVW